MYSANLEICYRVRYKSQPWLKWQERSVENLQVLNNGQMCSRDDLQLIKILEALSPTLICIRQKGGL